MHRHESAQQLPKNSRSGAQGTPDLSKARGKHIAMRPPLNRTTETASGSRGASLVEGDSSLRSNAEPYAALLDGVVMVLLTIFAALTRFWRLSEPKAVVFDEFHFGKFVEAYFTGEYFFDIHPPLGKLLLALGAYLHGYNASFSYDQIGAEYPDKSYVGARTVAAVFGTLLVPLMYLVARELSLHVAASVLAAAWVLLEVATTIESRHILTDSQLLFFLLLHFYCVLRLWRTRDGTRARWRWLYWSGISAGLALSIKWTALATPALAGVVSVFGSRALLRSQKRIPLWQCVFVGLLALALYTSFFWIHFRLLPRSGSGDAFMLPDFRAKLIGSPEYNAAAAPVPFFRKFVYLNKEMLRANAQVPGRHHWESKWWSWPLNLRGILYWIQTKRAPWAENPNTTRSAPAEANQHGTGVTPRSQYPVIEARVYLILNPVIAWSVLCSLLFFGFLLAQNFIAGLGGFGDRAPRRLQTAELPKKQRRSQQKLYALGTYLFTGWLLNLLPYIGVKRAAFLYHYLPGLLYGILLTALLVDRAPLPRTGRYQLVTIGVLLAAAAFIYFSPWIYGLYLTIEEQQKRRWLRGWN